MVEISFFETFLEHVSRHHADDWQFIFRVERQFVLVEIGRAHDESAIVEDSARLDQQFFLPLRSLVLLHLLSDHVVLFLHDLFVFLHNAIFIIFAFLVVRCILSLYFLFLNDFVLQLGVRMSSAVSKVGGLLKQQPNSLIFDYGLLLLIGQILWQLSPLWCLPCHILHTGLLARHNDSIGQHCAGPPIKERFLAPKGDSQPLFLKLVVVINPLDVHIALQDDQHLVSK